MASPLRAETAPEPPPQDNPELIYLQSSLSAHSAGPKKSGPALSFRVAKGWKPTPSFPQLRLGAEVWLAAMGASSAVYTLASVESTFTLSASGVWSAGLGVLPGAGFLRNVGSKTQTAVFFGEAWLAARLDDLASLRFFGRVGSIGSGTAGGGGVAIGFSLR